MPYDRVEVHGYVRITHVPFSDIYCHARYDIPSTTEYSRGVQNAFQKLQILESVELAILTGHAYKGV